MGWKSGGQYRWGHRIFFIYFIWDRGGGARWGGSLEGSTGVVSFIFFFKIFLVLRVGWKHDGDLKKFNIFFEFLFFFFLLKLGGGGVDLEV